MLVIPHRLQSVHRYDRVSSRAVWVGGGEMQNDILMLTIIIL